MLEVLPQYLENLEKSGRISSDLAAVILSIAKSCAKISALVRNGTAGDALGELGAQNVQGETQTKLDVLANEILAEDSGALSCVAGIVSEEMESFQRSKFQYSGTRFLVLFDPLDGSSNTDVNVSIGTIFSVLAQIDADGSEKLSDSDFLKPGKKQVAAGYAVYGPQTSLVFSIGNGVVGFTLSPISNDWLLTEPDMRIPEDTNEFSINMAYMRHWAPPVRRYVDECITGKSGPRGKSFNMRWVGSMVADVHRTIRRGGIFMYPWDDREPSRPGKLRLMYEANPMGMVVEQAGGIASDGMLRTLDIQPSSLHQRVGVVFGSKNEVERVMSYAERQP